MEKMVNYLNEFLSDLEIFNVKLQNYHWNVTGKGFFITHEKLEEYYNDAREEIDEIAEHILALGYQPLGTMQDFIKNSEIKEAENNKIKSLEIIKNVLKDLQILSNQAMKIKNEAEKSSNYATSAFIDNYLNDYAKKIWMLNETIK